MHEKDGQTYHFSFKIIVFYLFYFVEFYSYLLQNVYLFKSFSQSITDIDPDLMVGLNGFEKDLPHSKVTFTFSKWLWIERITYVVKDMPVVFHVSI